MPQPKFDTAVYDVISPSSPSVISEYNTKHKISFPHTASSHGKPVFDILCRPVGVAASLSQKEKEVTLFCWKIEKRRKIPTQHLLVQILPLLVCHAIASDTRLIGILRSCRVLISTAHGLISFHSADSERFAMAAGRSLPTLVHSFLWHRRESSARRIKPLTLTAAPSLSLRSLYFPLPSPITTR